jgi:transketolase N-terminal domain/subunit
MVNITELNQLTTQVRRDILRMVHKVNSGHPGGSLGCAEFFVALYNEVMELKEGFDMDGKEEDLFFFIQWTYLSSFLQRFSEKRLLPSRRIKHL